MLISPAIAISAVLSVPRGLEFFVLTHPFLCKDGRQIEPANNSTNMYYREEKLLNNSECIVVNISDVLIHSWTDIVTDGKYILYLNIVDNILTYLIPLLLLFVLNFLIYIYLKRRRKSIRELGMYMLYFK